VSLTGHDEVERRLALMCSRPDRIEEVGRRGGLMRDDENLGRL
jgi:hypothetical protein